MNDATMTIAEVAKLTGFSPQTVTRLFENEPGVLIVDRPSDFQKQKRRYPVSAFLGTFTSVSSTDSV